jgi:hypothetical protein
MFETTNAAAGQVETACLLAEGIMVGGWSKMPREALCINI